MKNFAKRISALRKERHLTQAEMAKDLALSRQTVSNWEKGAIEPNMGIVSKIATYFDVSTDYLMGHETYTTQYEEKYKQEGFYWGDKVNDLAHEVLKLMPPTRPVRLLDIGCGEGQAAVFFSRVGYHVSAFDIAESGLAKGRRLAATAGVRVNFFRPTCCGTASRTPSTSFIPPTCSNTSRRTTASGSSRTSRSARLPAG